MDVVLRALLAFGLVLLVMRVGGRREVGQLTALDMIVLVTLGDLVSQGILQEDYSVTAMTLAVAVFALASYGLGWVLWRFPRTRPVIAGRPVVVVRDGAVLPEVMKSEHLTDADLAEAARQQGVWRLAEVDLGVVEVDGTFSFYRRAQDD